MYYVQYFLMIVIVDTSKDAILRMTEEEYVEAVERQKEEMLQWYKVTYNDTDCLFAQEEDALFNADGENMTFPENSIFFIETSCNGGLDFRQACSVESAARAHPWRQINVLFAGRDDTENLVKQNTLKILLKYKNVKFFKIHLKEYLKGTPLEEIVENGLIRSQYLLHHTSDVLRFITLYKFGGIYLDLDVITVKSYDNLPVKENFLGKDDDSFAVGVVGLTRSGIGKQIIDTILRNLQYNFNPEKWCANGIDVTKAAVEQVCSAYWENISSDICKGFKIYDTQYFYSIKDYYDFSAAYNKTLNLTNIYAYHLWNLMLAEDVIGKESLHSLLSKKYCPEVDKVSSVGYEKRLPGIYPHPIKTFRVERTRIDKLYGSITIGKQYQKIKPKSNRHKGENASINKEYYTLPNLHSICDNYNEINKHININVFKRTRWKHTHVKRSPQINQYMYRKFRTRENVKNIKKLFMRNM